MESLKKHKRGDHGSIEESADMAKSPIQRDPKERTFCSPKKEPTLLEIKKHLISI